MDAKELAKRLTLQDIEEIRGMVEREEPYDKVLVGMYTLLINHVGILIFSAFNSPEKRKEMVETFCENFRKDFLHKAEYVEREMAISESGITTALAEFEIKQ